MFHAFIFSFCVIASDDTAASWHNYPIFLYFSFFFKVKEAEKEHRKSKRIVKHAALTVQTTLNKVFSFGVTKETCR